MNLFQGAFVGDLNLHPRASRVFHRDVGVGFGKRCISVHLLKPGLFEVVFKTVRDVVNDRGRCRRFLGRDFRRRFRCRTGGRPDERRDGRSG